MKLKPGETAIGIWNLEFGILKNSQFFTKFAT
jgi:hypothetical protein